MRSVCGSSPAHTHHTHTECIHASSWSHGSWYANAMWQRVKRYTIHFIRRINVCSRLSYGPERQTYKQFSDPSWSCYQARLCLCNFAHVSHRLVFWSCNGSSRCEMRPCQPFRRYRASFFVLPFLLNANSQQMDFPSHFPSVSYCRSAFDSIYFNWHINYAFIYQCHGCVSHTYSHTYPSEWTKLMEKNALQFVRMG